MAEQPSDTALASFLSVLDNATLEDLEFLESEPFGHSDPYLCEKKIACRLAKVHDIIVPYPDLVVYIRATDLKRGAYWYVIDNSQLAPRTKHGHPKSISMTSEEEAKQMVLSRLRAAIAHMLTPPAKFSA